MVVRVIARRTRPVGPKDSNSQGADAERLACPGDDDADVMPARFGESSVLVRAFARDRRVEDDADLQLPQDVLRAAYVIPLRMREDDHREGLHAQPAELRGDLR